MMEDQGQQRLESWKEIAAYLQRDVRTAHRWEKLEGLPVHRHSHSRRASVYAFPSEIDAWREARRVLPEPLPPPPLWKTLFGTRRSWAFGVTMALSLVMVGNGLRPQAAEAQGTGPAARLMWTLPANGQITSHISRDGRFVPFVHWGKFGDIYLHDLETGTDRQLTDGGKDRKPGAEGEEFGLETALSWDGTKLAYAWYRSDHDRAELRTLNVTANGVPAFRTLYDGPEAEWVAPADWSPDGKWVAVQISRKDQTKALGIVDFEKGTLRVLKSLEWRESNRMVFSPDGKYLAYDLPQADDTEDRDVFLLAVDGSRDSKVVAHPAHDTLLGWQGQKLLFGSTRSGPMGLWAQSVVDGRASGSPELVRADVGSAWESMGFTAGGALYSVRADQANRYNLQTATVDPDTGRLTSAPADVVNSSVGSTRMPVWSPDGRSLAYQYFQVSTGMKRFVLAIRSEQTGTLKEIVPSPNFKEIQGLSWVPNGKSLLVTGYEKGAAASVVQVDIETGKSRALTRDALFNGVMGDGGKKLYYIWQGFDADGKNFWRALMEKDMVSGTARELVRRGTVGGIRVSPDGKWVTVMTGTKNGQPLADVVLFPTTGGESRALFTKGDAMGVSVATWMPDSRSVRITRGISAQLVELWDVPVEGGSPRKLSTTPRSELAGPFALHPDGKRIARETRAPQKPAEVWALENILPAVTK